MPKQPSQIHSRRRRSGWRYVLWSILGLIGLLVLLLVIVQTPFFKSWVKGKVESVANESLQAHIEIDGLSGNLFTNIHLSGIRMLLDGDTVVSVSSVDIAWSPMDLFAGRLTIDDAQIDSVRAYLEEDSTTGWNVARITLPDTAARVDTTSVESELPFDIDLRRLRVSNTSVDIESDVANMPRRVRDLNLALSAVVTNDSQTVTLDSLSFATEQPHLRLKQLGFALYRDTTAMRLSDVVIATQRNRIDGRGEYRETVDEQSTVRLSSAQLRLDELSFLMPSISLGVSPVVSFDANLFRDTLEFNLLLDDDSSSVRITGRLLNLFGPASTPLAYQLSTDFRNVDVARWLADTAMDYTVNGWVRVDGQGTDPDSIVAQLTAGLGQTDVAGYDVDSADVQIDYNRGDTKLEVDVESDFGEVYVSGSVLDVLKTRRYDLNATLSRFNLAAILNDTLYRTDLNAVAHLSGDLEEVPPSQGSVELYLQPSSVTKYEIDTLAFEGRIADSTIHLDTLVFRTSFVEASASGTAHLSGPVDLDYEVRLVRPEELAGLIGADSLGADGSVLGHVAGTLDSLAIEAQLALQDIQYNEMRLEVLSGDVTASRVDSNLAFGGEVFGTGISGFDIILDSLHARFESDGTAYQFDLFTAQSDSMEATIVGTVRVDSAITAILSPFSLKLYDNTWSSGDSAIAITYTDDGLSVRNFRLSSPGTKGANQELLVDGIYRFEDSSDISFRIAHLNLSAVNSLLKGETAFSGEIMADLRFVGSLDTPVLRGRFSVIDGSVNEYSFRELSGDLDFDHARLDAVMLLHTNTNDSLAVSASLPVNVRPGDDGSYVRHHDSAQIDIVWHRLPLTVLAATGSEFENLTGEIDGRLRFYNTLADPRLAGQVQVSNGSFSMPEFGVHYRDLSAAIRFDTTRILIDSIMAHTEDGYLRTDGYLNFDSTLLAGHFRERRMQLMANNFYAVKHSDYEVKVSGNAAAEGNAEESKFSGSITVNRSNFWLPAFSKESGSFGSEATPLLVQAVGDTALAADTVQIEVQPSAADSLVQWFDNLRGRMTVNFPRNTWLRSPEMRIEIRGALDVVKESEYFELFGSISIVRGHYEILGKRFTFKEGTLTFDGGEQPNPRIDMTAEYAFRTPERERRTLTLHATGRAFAPEVQFSLDGVDIAEGDAAAYIVFGRSFDQLTQGQQSAVASSGGSSEGRVAGRLAANLLANELSKTIGKSLNLDVIEIKADESLSGAAIVVGKYITDRLFLSYQRGVGIGENDELAPEIVTIEFQFTRILFLQAVEGDSKESGFDALLKFHE